MTRFWMRAEGRGRIRALCLTATALALSASWACREPQPDPELEEPETVSVLELGQIGGRIYNEPERAREILDEAGIFPEEFEERVRRITNDPALAREYTRGFELVARPPLPLDDTLQADTAAPPDTGAAPAPPGG